MKNILVIGAGNVGAQIAQQGIAKGLSANFFLSDLNQARCDAQVLDLKDTLLYSNCPRVDSLTLDSPMIAEMDLVIITAGANQEPGENRCQLLDKNARLLGSLAEQLTLLPSHCVIMLVTNPVDIMTKIAQDVFPQPASQIIGTGTLLDSARLRWRLAEHLDINISNVHGYVLGEHGDSEFVAWSTVHPLDQLDDAHRTEMEDSVRTEAYDIINGKGATYFGIAAATIKLSHAILNDTKEVFPVSACCPNLAEPSLRTIPVGIPCVIGRDGVEKTLTPHLSETESEQLSKSAGKLFDLYHSCQL